MRGRKLWLLFALGISGGALSFVGCGGDNGLFFECEGDECDNGGADAGVDAPDGQGDAGVDPDAGDSGDVTPPGCDKTKSPGEDDCVIGDDYGIFVSPKGDDAGEGTMAAPFASLEKGLTEAKAANKRLYACDDGTGYAEKLTVNADLDGLEAFGGFSCDGWAYGSDKAKVKPGSAGTVWRFDNLQDGFLLADFEIEALDAENDGESSIAVIVNESEGVVFRGVNVTAGEGKEGASPASIALAAAMGAPGNPGVSECSDDPSGGATAETECDGVDTSGGKGGDGAIGNTSAGNGNQGLPDTMSGGAPGIGQTTSGGSVCQNGGDGQDGEAGEAGAGASGIGTLSGDGWSGSSGRAGKPGTPGQGGGGGGGGRRTTGCTTLVVLPVGTAVGPSGGSGGGGGCGGKGGDGGGPGGASIAIVSVDSKLELDGCNLTSGNGANGGTGSTGQSGGSGGARGNRGASSACHGGNGGDGGDGGTGGGGAGGHSLGIAYKGDKPTRTGGSVTIGDAGEGGTGVDAAGQGESGQSVEELEF